MKKQHNKIINTVVASVVTAALAGVAHSATAATNPNMEKCYGIVKAGMNDCGAPGHACAGQASTSASGSEWILVAKGSCNRIVGGSLTPVAASANANGSSSVPVPSTPANTISSTTTTPSGNSTTTNMTTQGQ